MARFRGGDLLFKDSQKVTFGTDLDSNIWWDATLSGGSAPGGDLRLDTTISGVDPTQSYHLTTRWYVDKEIGDIYNDVVNYITTSTGVIDHGLLDGLGDDDHTQYILVDGSRGFTGTVSGVYPVAGSDLATKDYVDDRDTYYYNIYTTSTGVIDHGLLAGLADDDHTQYILVDGTRGFTGVVAGITPTADNHLTTKQYVDDTLAQNIYGLDWQNSILNFAPYASGIAVEGNRYIATDSNGGWTEDYIMEYVNGTWSGIEPNEGFAAWNEGLDALYVYNDAYPTGEWVRFGATVHHNYLAGLQGGAVTNGGERYHLTLNEWQLLTSSVAASGVEDASSLHHHDGRYYTETELDGGQLDNRYYTETEVDNLLGDYVTRDGTQYFISTVSGVDPTDPAHLTTKQYVDDLIATLSGNIPYDHSLLTGLSADDHTQYVLVDGSRGFTGTVSGVDPVQPYHLATKKYVDDLTVSGGIDRSGITQISNGASQITVNFADIGSTDYVINATMENLNDSPPSIYAFIISNKTSSSFTVDFMGDMDSSNYYLDWTVVETEV